MRKGPAPKPTAQKKLAGNPGKRALNANEPVYSPMAAPELAPAWLAERAREEWARVAPQLVAQGVLTEVDRSGLEAYCIAYARWRQAEALLDTVPEMVTKAKTSGYLSQAPWVSIAQRYQLLMLRWASEFGFTPASRSRTESASAPLPATDPDEKFFSRKGDDPAGDGAGLH